MNDMSKFKRLLAYGLLVTLFYLGVSMLYYYWSMDRLTSGTNEVVGKVAYYERHAQEFDLLFLGDSRTYCAVSPEQIDALLGTRSYNLAHWSNWMVSQYALYEHLASRIPETTTVVWSLGRASFRDGEIAAKYPFSLSQARHFLDLGIPSARLLQTLAAFNPVTRFSLKRRSILEGVRSRLAQPVWNPLSASSAAAANEEGQEDWFARFSAPGVAVVEVLRQQGKVTSVALHHNLGNYERIEIDRDFFRAKRMETKPMSDAEAKAFVVPEPSEAYWKLFLESLDSFKAAHVNLVVNVLEEAPYSYRHSLVRRKWREFFMTRVAPEVKKRGIPFIYADFSSFTDEDYFDYNHMNSLGIKAYSPLLAKALAPYLLSQKKEQ
jgi:hypothetical protein